MTAGQRERAVAIAEAVIPLIKKNVFRAAASFGHFDYAGSVSMKAFREMKPAEQRELRLTGCAKGALFLGHLLLYGGKFPPPAKYHPVIMTTRRDFGRKNVDLMELAFEGFAPQSNLYSDYLLCDYKVLEKARQYKVKYDEPKARILKILRNVIKNDGEFVP